MAPEPGHQRLVLAKPPKPVSEMTDAERRDFAEKIYAGIATQQTGPHNATVDDLENPPEDDAGE